MLLRQHALRFFVPLTEIKTLTEHLAFAALQPAPVNLGAGTDYAVGKILQAGCKMEMGTETVVMIFQCINDVCVRQSYVPRKVGYRHPFPLDNRTESVPFIVCGCSLCFLHSMLNKKARRNPTLSDNRGLGGTRTEDNEECPRPNRREHQPCHFPC